MIGDDLFEFKYQDQGRPVTFSMFLAKAPTKWLEDLRNDIDEILTDRARPAEIPTHNDIRGILK